ncbi:YihY/virulence factor BrkB family protein [Paracoccus spongiarum]|uniref:YihY/virulence factor BrkB family protein n=1 Tax=Paracoccus spongiarum TaxID=3064387 RepID=A0ABT9JDA5_9RHOB|nr:YihY/virulence factor BrkB family protein [Paracoccus sp. 2205BS29-5]MDP5307811.1 YihY/virulence factor BrkB family protein [Paracoccus sp. 2205BS29-5]
MLDDLDDDTRRRFGLAGVGARPRSGRIGPGGGDVIAILRRTVDMIGEDRVTAVAGGITFFGLLSLFPAITAFVSIYGLVADPATITRHLDILQALLPEGALDIIRTQIESIAATPGSVLSLAGMVGLLAAFYSANGGMKALLSALNVAMFQTETRGFLRLNLVAMGFTLGGLLILATMLAVVAVVPILLEWLPDWLPLSADGAALVSLLRWPLLFMVLVLSLAAVYRWGPAIRGPQRRRVAPGAIIAAVALVATSMLFSWYAANFANYNETYGSLGAVIGLMMWLWLSATIVLSGAELNAAIEHRLREIAGQDAPAAQEGG